MRGAGAGGARAEMDVGLDERDARHRELAAAEHPPGVEPHDESRGPQQHTAPPRLAEHDAVEHGFRTVPAPADGELSEADVESGVLADQRLEFRAVLRLCRTISRKISLPTVSGVRMKPRPSQLGHG